ncbi:alanine racemase [Pontibacter sp. JH31]|uniref:Alanine racemase n=1 Tax=Pontibacter aquaedesilientis TaxID=2766980 RepID=A0ABR7XCZ5_9BACT|nr:alanine racemase [Pontibacter aquaedesilientis]MBD1396173.1 alanine racemase [Pontibacter aquaedesilientis]
MFHSSYIEISKSALQHNISFIKEQLAPDVRLSSVVKGNAYGHGIEEFVGIAHACGLDHFSVFSADEAFRIQQVLPNSATIMIMGFIDDSELEWAVAHDIEFYVFSTEKLESAAVAARKLQKPARVHLDIETGMNRIGLGGDELERAADFILANQALFEVAGICTHFAGAESQENHDRVAGQIARYNEAVDLLKTKGIVARQLHSACSAAVMAYPETHLDMVRVGIMQYGFWSSPEIYYRYMGLSTDRTDPLKRIINWKSHIMSLKLVKAGEFIGYGTSYQATFDMKTAAVPVGYAWGYSRALSNQGEVLIREHRAPVVGIVNMNVLMVDVTGIPDVALKDEVVLLGNQGKESITVASFAELSTQLNYELLTRLPMNIPRYIID